jgi:DNA modification methylase
MLQATAFRSKQQTKEQRSTVKNKIAELLITYQLISALKTNPRNARTHTKHQIRQIAKSIKVFGFTNPVLVDKDNTIIAGHGRVDGAKVNGMTVVPTIRLENLSPDQVRAYIIADNRLAEKAGWDKSILAIELQHLLAIDDDFDVSVTGFEIPEIDVLLAPDNNRPDPDDTFEVAETSQAVTSVGDLWHLGKHRILCGNSAKRESYSQLMASRRAGVVFTDPPYNVAIDGHVSGNGSVRHREFQMGSGELTDFQHVSLLASSLRHLVHYSTSGSVHFVCMDWRHMDHLLSAGRQVYDSVLNVCVWVKNNGGMGSFYRSRHELVFVFRNGKGQHRNNVQLGRYARNRTNVWEYPSVNTLSKVSDEGNLLALHPTVKPVALVADALLDSSARGDVVLDAFLGSGSTLIAAERTGRVCYGIEIDPAYVDTAIRRWQRYTGDHAIHAVSGKRFDDIANENLEASRG